MLVESLETQAEMVFLVCPVRLAIRVKMEKMVKPDLREWLVKTVCQVAQDQVVQEVVLVCPVQLVKPAPRALTVFLASKDNLDPLGRQDLMVNKEAVVQLAPWETVVNMAHVVLPVPRVPMAILVLLVLRVCLEILAWMESPVSLVAKVFPVPMA